MTTTISIRGWRWERIYIKRWRECRFWRRHLRRRDAQGLSWKNSLRRRSHLSTKGRRCGRRGVAQLSVGYLSLRCRLFLSTVVHDVSLLTSHGIVDCVQSRRARDRRDNWLKTTLKLLVVESIVWSHCRLKILLLLAHIAVDAHVLHLLLCNGQIEKLLLQSLRLLSQVLIGRHQFSIVLWV